MIVSSVPMGKLCFETLERVKLVDSVEILVVPLMAALHFSVVSGRVGLDLFVLPKILWEYPICLNISTPLYDGNGRLGRFILSHLLSQNFDSLLAYRFSYTFQKNISEYYKVTVERS